MVGSKRCTQWRLVPHISLMQRTLITPTFSLLTPLLCGTPRRIYVMTKKSFSYSLGFLQLEMKDEREIRWKEVGKHLAMHFYRKSLLTSFALSAKGWNALASLDLLDFQVWYIWSQKSPYVRFWQQSFCLSLSHGLTIKLQNVFSWGQMSDIVESKQQQSQVKPPNPPKQC